MTRNERINPEPEIGSIEASIHLDEAGEILREIIENPPEILELHVYWCKKAEDGSYIPDRHGEICIEAVAEYLLLVKELNLSMPKVAISVGFPNLYEGNSMSTVYANHLRQLLLSFGFDSEEIENSILDEAVVRQEDQATETLGELEFLHSLSAHTKRQTPPLSVSRAFHGPRIKMLIEANQLDQRYASAEALLALLNPGRLTQLLDEDTIAETEALWRSEEAKILIMKVDSTGRLLREVSNLTSGEVKEWFQIFTRQRPKLTNGTNNAPYNVF